MKNKSVNTPKISVIMPVYNTEKFVGEAIDSILTQSFIDFELIIIDDCSQDDSYTVCEKYAETDKRIRLYKNKENIWVVKTRNRLLSKVSPGVQYIAIMDADDVSHKDRLMCQKEFLDTNSNYSIVWSNISVINESSQNIGNREYPEKHSNVKKSIFKRSPLAQPSVMIRKRDLDIVWNYDEDFERCQDYELWFRFFDAGYKIWNIQKQLLWYRVFSEQGKSKHLKLTLKNTMNIQKKYIFKREYFSFWNAFYFIAESILLILPGAFILWVFKKITY